MDTTAPIPGVAQITYPDGTSEFKYTDELEAALVRAEAASYAPVVQPQPAAQPITIQIVGAQPNLPAVPTEQRQLVEPWMVRGAAGLGLAGGGALLAPVIAEGAASVSAGLGSVLMIALQIGGPAVAALILVNLFSGQKSGGGPIVEVVQTITQEITQTTRIQK